MHSFQDHDHHRHYYDWTLLEFYITNTFYDLFHTNQSQTYLNMWQGVSK